MVRVASSTLSANLATVPSKALLKACTSTLTFLPKRTPGTSASGTGISRRSKPFCKLDERERLLLGCCARSQHRACVSISPSDNTLERCSDLGIVEQGLHSLAVGAGCMKMFLSGG